MYCQIYKYDETPEHRAIENEANQFAGAFLLPEESFLFDTKTAKVKSIIDLVAKRGMIENDWMVKTSFFHRITGINLSFLDNYMIRERDFELVNVSDLSSVIREKDI